MCTTCGWYSQLYGISSLELPIPLQPAIEGARGAKQDMDQNLEQCSFGLAEHFICGLVERVIVVLHNTEQLWAYIT